MGDSGISKLSLDMQTIFAEQLPLMWNEGRGLKIDEFPSFHFESAAPFNFRIGVQKKTEDKMTDAHIRRFMKTHPYFQGNIWGKSPDVPPPIILRLDGDTQ